MVLNQNEYTMASLGFNYQKPPLFLPNQTHPFLIFPLKVGSLLPLTRKRSLLPPPSSSFLFSHGGRRRPTSTTTRRADRAFSIFLCFIITHSHCFFLLTVHHLPRSTSFFFFRRKTRRTTANEVGLSISLVLQVTSLSTYVFLIVSSLFSLSSLLTVGFFISVESGGVRRR